MKRTLALIAMVLIGGLPAGCFDSSSQESSNNVPSTTQPAAVQGPGYTIQLIDPLYESTAGAKAVAVGDIDRDGRVDFASISAESQRVQVHFQTANQEFDTVAIVGGAPITLPTSIALADLNDDGRLDIIVLVSDTGFASPDGSSDIAGALILLFQGADAHDATDWLQYPRPGYLPPANLSLPGGDGTDGGPTSLLVGALDERSGVDIAVLVNGPERKEVRLFSNPGGSDATDPDRWVHTVIESDIVDLGQGCLADLDKDGDLDVILSVPTGKSYNLRWLANPLIGSLGSGNGTPTYVSDQFGASFEATARATAVVLGDIDNDGNVDLASISSNSQPVQIHLRNVDTGDFDTISIASGPPLKKLKDLALADLNRDGKLDLVLLAEDTGLTGGTAQPALVLLVQGSDPRDSTKWTLVPGLTGSFPKELQFGTAAVGDLTIGDIDGANGPDIIVTTTGALRVFPNPGDAAVTDATAWSSTVLETEIADDAKAELADVDDDGDEDVVIADPGATGFNLRWLANPRVNPPADDATTPAYLSDLVRPDLIDPLFESTAGAKAVALGDLDGDGVTDAVSVSDENQTVQIHLMDPNTGVFDAAITIAGGGPLTKMNDVDLADFNADGRLDIVVLVEDSGFAPPDGVTKIGALVFLIQGADPTHPAQWAQVDFLDDPTMPPEDRGLYFLNNDASLVDMVTGDFTNDGLPDVVVASNEDPQPPHVNIYLFANPGAANVTDATQWDKQTIDSDIPDYSRLSAGDIDGDGDLDVIASVPEAKSFNLRWLENSNDGATWTLRLVGQQQGGAEYVALGDIDGDGDLDVASSSAQMKLTQWFRNPGPAALATGAQYPWDVFNIGELTDAPGDINQLQLVDMNGDGQLDAFVTTFDSGAKAGSATGFRWLDNIEDTWEPFQIDSTEAEIGRVAFFDFDANGRLDFIAPLNFEGLTNDRIAFYTSVTDIRWQRNTIGHQDSGANFLAVGDIDADGSPDVAAASTELGLIQWYKNPGAAGLISDGLPVPWKVYNLGDMTSFGGGDISQIQLVDLDGDDSLDLFLTSEGVAGTFYRSTSLEDAWGASLIENGDALIGRVAFSDFDGDGDLDFVAPLDREGVTNDEIVIYTLVAENQWDRRMIVQQPGNTGVIAVGDIDGDGYIDVAAPSDNLTQWFRNPGATLQQSTSQVPWDVFNVGEVTEAPLDQIQLVDLDQDGQLKVFVTAAGKAWGFQPGEDIENYWTRFPLFNTDPLANIGTVGFVDVNEDGRLDFIAPVDRVDLLVKDYFVLFLRK